jgi:predicted  nucleic acid-binding Zn-ribbon protein
MAETVDADAAPPIEDEAAKDDEALEKDEAAEEDEAAGEDEGPSMTELLVKFGNDVSVLAFCEAQLAASRNMPEVRRAARDIAGALVAAFALLTAFVFANVTALRALTDVMAPWLAALVLCGVWLVIGAGLVVALMVRGGRIAGWKWWRLFTEGRAEALRDLEQARDAAREAVRETLAQLAPAITVEIASASVGVAGDVAGDMAGDVVESGQEIIESSDEFVESIAVRLPGGRVVNQMWDVVLMPGRLGIKVATTVFKRAD